MKFVADYVRLRGDRKTNLSKRVGQIGAKLSDPLFASVVAECRSGRAIYCRPQTNRSPLE
jgi:hypothetical protein